MKNSKQFKPVKAWAIWNPMDGFERFFNTEELARRHLLRLQSSPLTRSAHPATDPQVVPVLITPLPARGKKPTPSRKGKKTKKT